MPANQPVVRPSTPKPAPAVKRDESSSDDGDSSKEEEDEDIEKKWLLLLCPEGRDMMYWDGFQYFIYLTKGVSYFPILTYT